MALTNTRNFQFTTLIFTAFQGLIENQIKQNTKPVFVSGLQKDFNFFLFFPTADMTTCLCVSSVITSVNSNLERMERPDTDITWEHQIELNYSHLQNTGSTFNFMTKRCITGLGTSVLIRRTQLQMTTSEELKVTSPLR